MTATAILDRAAPKPIPCNTLLEKLAWPLHFRNNALELTRRMHDRHGPVVSNGWGPMRNVSLFGPEANRFLLLDRDGIFSAQQSWELIMGRIFGGGLLLRDGSDHRHHRRIMREAFRPAALAEYGRRMNPRMERTVEAWTHQGNRLHAFPAIKELALEMAFDIFIGVELGEDKDRLNHAFEAMVAAAMSILRLPIPGLEFQRGLEGKRLLSETFARLLPERRANPGGDMLSEFCRARSEEGDQLNDREIIDHTNFLMMAAHDTTTSTLTSLVYLLARHPEWQERVREESLAFDEPWVTYENQDRLETLTHCIHETLRLYPPLSTIPRVATRDFEYEGFAISQGSLVTIYPIHTHRMPEWWTDPERFDPDRFSLGRQEHRRHTHLWIPFGGGAHMCLGLRFAELQTRCLIHQLVRRVRWEIPDGYRMPVQEAPISKPRDGLPIRLTVLQ
jgi:cytochrome P450